MDGAFIALEDEEFTRALNQYLDVTSKTVTEAINAKAKDLCFQAARQINSGDPSRDYPKGSRIYHVLAAGGNSRKNGQSLETRFGKAPKGKGNKKLADKIYSRRRRSKGYSRAICVKMAGDFGARLTVKAGKINYASGTPAKPSIRPVAYLNVKGLEKEHVDNELQPAFERGLRIVTRDMRKYLSKKMERDAKKHSGKKR